MEPASLSALADGREPWLLLDGSRDPSSTSPSTLFTEPEVVLTERDDGFVELREGQTVPVDDPIAWLKSAPRDEELHWAGMLGFEFAWLLDHVNAPLRRHRTPRCWVAGWRHAKPVVLDGELTGRGALADARLRVDDAVYEERVRRAIEAIWEGELFEVNYTERFAGRWSARPWDLYTMLRQRSTGAFFAYLQTDEFAVASVSPEEFLRVDARRVVTRPIKGTRRRGQGVHDEVLREELRRSPKDRAENIMIVDLMRNDLTRFSTPGTVRATRLCEVESFAGVHHLVSTVESELDENVTPIEALLSAFPAGSITGAPKLRSIELITALEEDARGPYTGTIFHVSSDRLRSSVLIRTAVICEDEVEYGAGGAVVADSNPSTELDESYVKAAGFLSLRGEV